MSTGLRFTLEVDGLPPDVFAVVSFHLSQSYSSLFTLDISLVSQQLHSIEFSQILEKMAYLKIWQGNETEDPTGLFLMDYGGLISWMPVEIMINAMRLKAVIK